MNFKNIISAVLVGGLRMCVRWNGKVQWVRLHIWRDSCCCCCGFFCRAISFFTLKFTNSILHNFCAATFVLTHRTFQWQKACSWLCSCSIFWLLLLGRCESNFPHPSNVTIVQQWCANQYTASVELSTQKKASSFKVKRSSSSRGQK